MARRVRGFTLVELLIALAIVGALLVVAFGGLRVALAAWTQGEDRAEAHQHLRGLALVLGRTLGAAAPYRAPEGQASEPVLLFRGAEDRVEFVTRAALIPAAVPVAFTAVAIGLERDEAHSSLVVRQRILPNREPFVEASPVLRDPRVAGLKLEYLNAAGEWLERWDGAAENGLPRAVRISLDIVREGRTEPLPPLTVTLWMAGTP